MKYKTRVKKDWYLYKELNNTVAVQYDDKTVNYNAVVYASNYENALTKQVNKDPKKRM
ncbi:hypothetical protein [Enterococcus rivorum]|uniref:hypothetical protein n=1 Tax=Enterococcus rivorum TaxID=762845 RepID=UPI00362F6894